MIRSPKDTRNRRFRKGVNAYLRDCPRCGVFGFDSTFPPTVNKATGKLYPHEFTRELQTRKIVCKNCADAPTPSRDPSAIARAHARKLVVKELL